MNVEFGLNAVYLIRLLGLAFCQAIITTFLFWIHEEHFGTNLSQDLSWMIPLIFGIIGASWLNIISMKKSWPYFLLAAVVVGGGQLVSMILSVAICGE